MISIHHDVLAHAADRLVRRLQELEARLEGGDESWPDYLATLQVLALVAGQVTQERRGALLTTKELAARWGVAPKTLLRWKRRGVVKPALETGQRGRGAVRWRAEK